MSKLDTNILIYKADMNCRMCHGAGEVLVDGKVTQCACELPNMTKPLPMQHTGEILTDLVDYLSDFVYEIEEHHQDSGVYNMQPTLWKVQDFLRAIIDERAAAQKAATQPQPTIEELHKQWYQATSPKVASSISRQALALLAKDGTPEHILEWTKRLSDTTTTRKPLYDIGNTIIVTKPTGPIITTVLAYLLNDISHKFEGKYKIEYYGADHKFQQEVIDEIDILGAMVDRSAGNK